VAGPAECPPPLGWPAGAATGGMIGVVRKLFGFVVSVVVGAAVAVTARAFVAVATAAAGRDRDDRRNDEL
jgi:hypothetical protein